MELGKALKLSLDATGLTDCNGTGRREGRGMLDRGIPLREVLFTSAMVG
jgi:hypothetical protein